MQSNYKRWIVAALPLAMACTVSAQGKVTDVSTRAVDGGLAVHIGGSDLAKPTTKWDNGALVLQFQSDSGPKSTVLKPNKGGIKAVSFGKEGATFNVAIRPTGAKDPQIVQVGDGWLVYFEQPISDKVTPYTTSTITKAQQKAQGPIAPVNPRDFKPKALVTLNFVDTDIQQIIKALSIQANVNVAMGPDVVGKVTINLDNVPVDEAMDMVTTLGGVNFGYVNNTYVVASSANFAATMERMYHRAGLSSETRVVPLFSRDGNDIKAAMLKSVPSSTPEGRYELALPSEKTLVTQSQAITPGAGAPGGKDDKGAANGAAATQTDTKVQQASSMDSSKKDDYIVLIGTPGRMDEIEKRVRLLDEQICFALGLKVGTSQAIVRQTYEPKGILAQDLVKALVGGDKKEFNDVQILATPSTSVSKQSIVLNGREADVDRVMSMLKDLDTTPDSAETQYEIVGLKYIKPNFAKVQLMQNVPGVRASFLPPPVDPKVGIQYDEQATQSGSGSGSGGDGNSGSGSAAAGGSSQTGGPQAGGTGSASSGALGSNGQTSTGGVVQTSTKSNSVPMKLLLRGTPEQIDSAKKFLTMVDLAPKQVAVELRVMELSHEEALKVGLDWNVLTGGTLQSLHINQATGSDSTAGGIKGVLGFKGGGSLGVLGTLDSLSNKNNVLARPSILVNDGVPTDMFVGDEIRYIKSIQSTQQGVTVETDEIDVGVDFALTARIGDDGNILLDLSPTLKVLEGFTPVPGGGQLPQTSRRSASSQMSIKSGETIAIGGLIQEQDRKNYSGIPILKDLPLIGRLFGRTDHDKIRSEVVFFVTVKEVTEADRQGVANPRQAERTNKINPGDKDGKSGGK